MHAVALGWDRTVLELKMYFREKTSVFFSFLFPIMMLALFATIFANQFTGTAGSGADRLTAGRFFLPGMIAAGVMLTSFQTIALSVATERDDGTLKRLRSTPMPPVSYFLGKVGLVGLTSLAQMVLLLAVARFGYDVALPTDAGRWWTFAWVFVLGVFSGTVIGVAYSSVTSARSGAPVVIAPILVLQFISGVYFSFSDIPTWLQQVGALFPLKWIAQGMRSVFFPASMAGQEMAGSWEPGRTALVLVAWSAVGLVLCVRTFRWYRKGSV